MSELGKTIIAFCVQDKNCLAQCIDKLDCKYFEETEFFVYKAISEFFKERKQIITRNLLDKVLDSYDIEPEQALEGTDIYDIAKEEKIDLQEFEYHLEQFKKDYIKRSMVSCLDGGYTKQGNIVPSLSEIAQKDPFEACEIFKKNVIFPLEEYQNNGIANRGTLGGLVNNVRQRYAETKANPNKSYGIKTGYDLIDNETLGVHAGELFLIGGRTGAGKSILLLNMAVNMYRNGSNILIISLEMSLDRYQDRFYACYCEIPSAEYMKGRLSKDEEARLETALQRVAEEHKKGHYLLIADIPSATALTVDAEINRAILECGFKPHVVFVDYLGIMKSIDKKKSDWEDQGAIAEEIRRLARTSNIPIVSAVQLNRDKQKSKGSQRIGRSDIIGQTCDVFLQIEEKDEEQEDETGASLADDTMAIFLGKVRNGRSNETIHLWKDFGRMLIKNKDTSFKSPAQKMQEDMENIETELSLVPKLNINTIQENPPEIHDNENFINVS